MNQSVESLLVKYLLCPQPVALFSKTKNMINMVRWEGGCCMRVHSLVNGKHCYCYLNVSELHLLM